MSFVHSSGIFDLDFWRCVKSKHSKTPVPPKTSTIHGSGVSDGPMQSGLISLVVRSNIQPTHKSLLCNKL